MTMLGSQCSPCCGCGCGYTPTRNVIPPEILTASPAELLKRFCCNKFPFPAAPTILPESIVDVTSTLTIRVATSGEIAGVTDDGYGQESVFTLSSDQVQPLDGDYVLYRISYRRGDFTRCGYQFRGTKPNLLAGPGGVPCISLAPHPFTNPNGSYVFLSGFVASAVPFGTIINVNDNLQMTGWFSENAITFYQTPYTNQPADVSEFLLHLAIGQSIGDSVGSLNEPLSRTPTRPNNDSLSSIPVAAHGPALSPSSCQSLIGTAWSMPLKAQNFLPGSTIVTSGQITVDAEIIA